MIKKIIIRLKQLASDYRWWGFFIQRQFLEVHTRERIADIISTHFRPKASSRFLLTDADLKLARELSSTGIALLGELIPASACNELVDYFKDKPVCDPYRESNIKFRPLEDNKRNPESHIAHHDATDILHAPYLMDIANDPRIIGIIEHVLGCKPTIGYMAAWWSYSTKIGAQQAEHFHRDVDDWRFFKLFIYLTDVDEKKGPHVYVRNTSKSSKLSKIKRYTNDEVRESFPLSDIMSLTADKGHAFIENTYGIHKGQPVEEGIRLIFQVVYTLSPIPYGPTRPIVSASNNIFSKYDSWMNRIYIKPPK